MFRALVVGFFAATAILPGGAAAWAHVRLETKQARIGSPAVQVSDGIIEVKPMPRPGWSLRVETGHYLRRPHTHRGVTLTEGAALREPAAALKLLPQK